MNKTEKQKPWNKLLYDKDVSREEVIKEATRKWKQDSSEFWPIYAIAKDGPYKGVVMQRLRPVVEILLPDKNGDAYYCQYTYQIEEVDGMCCASFYNSNNSPRPGRKFTGNPASPEPLL